MTSGSELVAAASERVSFSGWLHVIWNGQPRFILVNDQGVAIRLLVDEAVMKASGGMRGINQRRVTITGERAAEMPEAVRVLSIKLEVEGK